MPLSDFARNTDSRWVRRERERFDLRRGIEERLRWALPPGAMYRGLCVLTWDDTRGTYHLYYTESSALACEWREMQAWTDEILREARLAPRDLARSVGATEIYDALAWQRFRERNGIPAQFVLREGHIVREREFTRSVPRSDAGACDWTVRREAGCDHVSLVWRPEESPRSSAADSINSLARRAMMTGETVLHPGVAAPTWTFDGAAQESRLAVIARAEAWLLEFLSPAQIETWQRNRWFDVLGSATQTTYRLHDKDSINVEELDGAGMALRRWCLTPVGVAKYPRADMLIAQKLCIETDEPAFRAAARKWPLVSLAQHLERQVWGNYPLYEQPDDVPREAFDLDWRSGIREMRTGVGYINGRIVRNCEVYSAPDSEARVRGYFVSRAEQAHIEARMETRIDARERARWQEYMLPMSEIEMRIPFENIQAALAFETL